MPLILVRISCFIALRRSEYNHISYRYSFVNFDCNATC